MKKVLNYLVCTKRGMEHIARAVEKDLRLEEYSAGIIRIDLNIANTNWKRCVVEPALPVIHQILGDLSET